MPRVTCPLSVGPSSSASDLSGQNYYNAPSAVDPFVVGRQVGSGRQVEEPLTSKSSFTRIAPRLHGPFETFSLTTRNHRTSGLCKCENRIEWCYGRNVKLDQDGRSRRDDGSAGRDLDGTEPAVTESSRMPEYFDEQVALSVEPPTASRSTIRLHVTESGVGTWVDLSATGASRLARMLEAAAIAAAAADLGQDAL